MSVGFYVFTLHFATINTYITKQVNIGNYVFTLHFATINTYKIC